MQLLLKKTMQKLLVQSLKHELPQIEEVLSKNALFEHFGADVIEVFKAHAAVNAFEEDKYLFKKGENVNMI